MIGLLGRTRAGRPSLVSASEAARGRCWKEKAVDRSAASRSRVVSGASDQLCSMNFKIAAESYTVWLAVPGVAYGLTSSAGTRGPSWAPSWVGGATWSYQPPEVS